jgi:hypothetical protein
VIIVFAVAVIPFLPGQMAKADWRDSLKELKDKADGTKEKWKESERRCQDCGKVIHGRDLCTSCEARRLAERAREAKENVQQKWQNIERRCVDCGKVVHGADRCIACEGKRFTAKAHDIAKRTGEAAREIKETWDANKDRWWSESRQAAELSAYRFQEILNDPEKRRECVKRALALKGQVELTIIRSVPVMDPDTGEIIPFDSLMRKMVKDAGMGGSLGEDPVGAAYMMMIDSDYLCSTARLIPSPSGEYVTLSEALLAFRGLPGAFNQRAVEQAAQSHTRMRIAYQGGDGTAFQEASLEFASAIREMNSARPSTAVQHLAFLAKVDGSLALVVTYLQDSHVKLQGAFKNLGADDETATWLATGSIGLGCLLLLLMLRTIMRAGLKAKLRRTQKELEALREQQEGRMSPVRTRKITFDYPHREESELSR